MSIILSRRVFAQILRIFLNLIPYSEWVRGVCFFKQLQFWVTRSWITYEKMHVWGKLLCDATLSSWFEKSRKVQDKTTQCINKIRSIDAQLSSEAQTTHTWRSIIIWSSEPQTSHIWRSFYTYVTLRMTLHWYDAKL